MDSILALLQSLKVWALDAWTLVNGNLVTEQETQKKLNVNAMERLDLKGLCHEITSAGCLQ